MSALKKILVVDDDPVVGKSFNRVLSAKGYTVTTVENAKAALSELQAGNFDVVYTDIRMPGMDGIELAERVKARQPWTPVVIVTGYGTKANEERARAAGVSAFLQKPLSPEMIEVSAVDAMAVTAPAIAAEPVARLVESARPEPAVEQSALKQFSMLIAAPFIGLAFILTLPFVGLGLLVALPFKALALRFPGNPVLKFAKNAGLFFAAPFVGLAYVVAMPFVGMGTLAWIGYKALTKKPAAE